MQRKKTSRLSEYLDYEMKQLDLDVSSIADIRRKKSNILLIGHFLERHTGSNFYQ